ncbi:aminotransferase class III-fold pyridoxal phosphate-dependent enzyme [Phenylobacterium sp. J367]|uniref:aminotransferase class III-fold pyridoxal phosphate-dependent enzyme n=1 Tax=Phenylobacterium sp. J367 TaxID=2898435 RepID=UPI0021513DD9|nr:aminotransferase class III-fold pyridoxal phosphate-dependent enzyme [Phenylobacterium sp. J367]MCR5880955.1 aminotransferase class III-fold pyridoxal phosphate-dependent enzyme [Phenylobacterium sp. J367]
MAGANSRDRELRERAAAVIPGGMYGHQSVALLPDDCPQFFERGEGAHIWDADGRRYLDFMCAYGPNLFGYAQPEIDAAYVRQLGLGDTLTGPTALMVELAEALTGMVSHADWAMFCKNGTDATSMALVVSRAHTKRKTVVRAKGAYHGAAAWCTPRPAGVIDSDRAHQLFYDYNDIASLEAAVAQAGDDLACIFAAPFKHDAFIDQAEPDPAYARRARELCDAAGALLVVDEVRAGFRLSRDCSWSRIGVQPDLSTWGKCVANGHAISALLGSDKARAAAASIYVTGSFWYAAAPMAAGLETLRLIRETDYLERITALGDRLRAGLAERASAAGFGFRQTGPSTLPLFLFDDDPDLRKGFCFASEMLARGVYVHPWHNMFLCAAMTEADIDQALDAAEGAFAALKRQVRELAPVEKLAFLSAGAR